MPLHEFRFVLLENRNGISINLKCLPIDDKLRLLPSSKYYNTFSCPPNIYLDQRTKSETMLQANTPKAIVRVEGKFRPGEVMLTSEATTRN